MIRIKCDAVKSLEDSIEEANTATWDGFYDMFARDGFKESGGNFIKNTTVGATLTDTLKEKHVIEGYNYYSTNVRDFTKDIRTPESIDLEAVRATGIQALLDQAMGAVDEESKRIFGDEDETIYVMDSFFKEKYKEEKTLFGEGTGIFVEKTRKIPKTDTITEDTYDEYLDALINLSDEKRSKEAQKLRYRKVQTGAFNEHVGYAPVFKDDADPDRSMKNYEKNVRFAGAGETGRIMGMYIQHKMIEGTGRAEANMPVYSRRLWDDRGSFMAAPTIRSLTDIAVTVAAGVVAPGAGNLLINTALNMIDDAIFTMMDIGNGMDPLDAMESLGKKAATSYVSGRIGGAFSSDGGLLNSTMLGNDFLGKTLTKGLELTMGNVASSAINSFSLRGLVEGGDIFDEDAFMEGSFGTNAMAGVVAGWREH